MDEDDRLGEDCIKLLTAEEAEAPYRNYMKNGKGEETNMGALGALGSMDIVDWFDVTPVETLVFTIQCRGFPHNFPWTNSASLNLVLDEGVKRSPQITVNKEELSIKTPLDSLPSGKLT